MNDFPYLADHFPYQEYWHPDWIQYYLDLGWSEQRVYEHLKQHTDPRIIETYTAMRKAFGPIFINNSHTGGTLRNAGQRVHPFQAHGKTYGELVGALGSTHYIMCAQDYHVVNHPPEYVEQYILNNPEDFPHVCRMESTKITTGWNHLEQGAREGNTIEVFNP